jgi:hypothetical protein
VTNNLKLVSIFNGGRHEPEGRLLKREYAELVRRVQPLPMIKESCSSEVRYDPVFFGVKKH